MADGIFLSFRTFRKLLPTLALSAPAVARILFLVLASELRQRAGRENENIFLLKR